MTVKKLKGMAANAESLKGKVGQDHGDFKVIDRDGRMLVKRRLKLGTGMDLKEKLCNKLQSKVNVSSAYEL